MKFEQTEVWGYKQAIRKTGKPGYRKTKNNKYETYGSINGRTVSLGTYDNEQDAAETIYEFRVKRFINGVHKAGYDETKCKVVLDNYVAFPTGQIFNLKGKEMIGCIDRAGYREVILNGKLYRVHRIIAETFISNSKNLPCVNHKDGNKLNNNVDNLEWVTHSENTIHSYQNGLEKKYLGEEHHTHKLTDEDVRFIKKVYKKRDKTFGSVPLSAKFGVDRTTISDIIRGRTWRHINV